MLILSFIVTRVEVDTTPPQLRNQKQSKEFISQGEYVSLQAEAEDSVSLSEAVLSANETGVWKNLAEHALLWKQDKVYGFDNFGTATYEDGILYAPSKGNHVSDGKVYAINASNGNIIWNASVRQCDASPCIDGDVIYVGECCSVLSGEAVPYAKAFALNKTNGKEIWNYTEPQGYGWIGSPIVHDDYVYYTTGYVNYTTGFTAGSGIYALNKTNGQKIWQKDIGFVVCSAAYDDGVVFISGSNHTNPQGQYALNATNGDIIWHVNYGQSWDSSPVVYNGMIIQVAGGFDTTYVLNETNGQLIREFEGEGSCSTPLVYEDKIFIPDDNGKIWAFDLETGEELLHTQNLHNGSFQKVSYCSPALAGGAIYYQSLNGTFYVINETDGDILWSYALGGLGFGSPSIGGGNVFITNDAALYAFRIGPGSGDWKMFCQNELHQSYSEYGIEYVRWPPIANFTYSPPAPYVHEDVAFDPSASLPGWNSTVPVPIANYTWNFGDGKSNVTTTDSTISHTFTASGNYTVTLTVEDTQGWLDTTSQTIIVTAHALSVSISPTSATMDLGQSKIFASTVSGGTSPYSYQWYLNSVAVSGATSSSWTFTPSSSGSYTVYLNVTDNAGFITKSNIASVTVNSPSSSPLLLSAPSIILYVSVAIIIIAVVAAAAALRRRKKQI
jgi:outer membrane protein assembly factor BamB